MIKKLLVLIIAIAVLGLVATGCARLPKSAVASVNGKVITREDLDRRIEDFKAQLGGQGLPDPESEEYKQFEKQIVEQLVTEQILFFEADKMGVTVSDDEVNQQLEQIKQQVGGEEQYRAALEQRNLTDDRLKDQIRSTLLFQKLYPEVTKDAAPVTDEEALKYYQENKQLFQKPESRKVQHILVKDEATANAVKARLDAGEDFATVAKEVSQDPGSKDKGGDLGDVPSSGSGYVKEFEDAMNKLPVGQISAPVKSSFGFHIIQVQEIKPAGTQTFEEAKEQIKQAQTLQNQRDAFEAWLKSVKGNYEIVYDPEFDPTVTTPVTVPETATQPAGTATPAPAPAQPQPAPAP